MNAEQKEQFLKLLSDAIDKGDVSINLTFYGSDKLRSEALENAVKLSEIVKSDVKAVKNDRFDWYTVDTNDFYAGFFHREDLQGVEAV